MPKTRVRPTLNEQLQAIVHAYMIEYGLEEVNLDDVAAWAVKMGLYQRQPKTMIQTAKEEIARALRAERHVDPQGRTVRTMHPVKIEGEQGALWEWVDMRTARPKRMRAAFSYRRQAIVADVLRHKTDVDSYNDNNRFGVQIPLFDYDFNKDVAESELPTNYDEEALSMGLDDLNDD